MYGRRPRHTDLCKDTVVLCTALALAASINTSNALRLEALISAPYDFIIVSIVLKARDLLLPWRYRDDWQAQVRPTSQRSIRFRATNIFFQPSPFVLSTSNFPAPASRLPFLTPIRLGVRF